jgi:hypothetical protein
MAAFEVAAALGIVAALGAAAWTALPSLLAPEPEPDEPEDVFATGDVAQRVAALSERVLRDDDDPRPWSRHPLQGDPERLPAHLVPARSLVVLDGHVLPLHPALLAATGGGDVLRGRRQGRPIHAVRLREGLYLDLIEALRLLPVIGLELAGRGLGGEVVVVDPADLDDELPVVCPWLLTGEGPRVTSDDEGARTFALTIGTTTVEATVWMPDVAAGIAADELRWAGSIRADAEQTTAATDPSILASLQLEATPPLGWTRSELLELAAVLHQLEQQDVDVSTLLLEVFADRRAPMPDLHDERQALVTAAVMNWVGAAHRRAGRPRAALAALEAAEAVCAPLDDDNRGDITHNRGLSWLDLHGSDPAALEAAAAAFTQSARLHPTDAEPWVHLALVRHLQGRAEAAADAWLQAATHAPDSDHYSLFMANAGARPSRDDSGGSAD